MSLIRFQPCTIGALPVYVSTSVIEEIEPCVNGGAYVTIAGRDERLRVTGDGGALEAQLSKLDALGGRRFGAQAIEPDKETAAILVDEAIDRIHAQGGLLDVEDGRLVVARPATCPPGAISGSMNAVFENEDAAVRLLESDGASDADKSTDGSTDIRGSIDPVIWGKSDCRPARRSGLVANGFLLNPSNKHLMPVAIPLNKTGAPGVLTASPADVLYALGADECEIVPLGDNAIAFLSRNIIEDESARNKIFTYPGLAKSRMSPMLIIGFNGKGHCNAPMTEDDIRAKSKVAVINAAA